MKPQSLHTMRSRDEGRTWENLTQIAYPKGARFVEQHLPTPDQDPATERPTTYKEATLLKVWRPLARRSGSRAVPGRSGSAGGRRRALGRPEC